MDALNRQDLALLAEVCTSHVDVLRDLENNLKQTDGVIRHGSGLNN